MAPAPVDMQDQRAELDTSWGAMVDGVLLRHADAVSQQLQVSWLCIPLSVLGPTLLKEQRLMHSSAMCNTQLPGRRQYKQCNLGDAPSVVHIVRAQRA